MLQKMDWTQTSVDRLYRGLAAAAILFTVLLFILFLNRSGPGPIVAELPWFIPLVGIFQGLALFSISFLALGRHNVLHHPSCFWIGMGAVGFGICLAFYALAWPGLLPGGGAIVGARASTPAWFLQIGITIYSVLLLAAVLADHPRNGKTTGGRIAMAASAWILLLILALCMVVRFEDRLPALLSSSGVFTVELLIWNAGAATLFAAGAVLSARRYRQTRDALLGYVSFSQMGFAFAVFATLSGMRRYDIWWYFARIVATGSALVVLIGLLLEYVRLFRRERERTDQALRAEKALRELNATLEQKVAERTKLAEARAKQLQALSVELIEAEERERRMVAELLHEDLQQILAAAIFHLQAAEPNLLGKAAIAKVRGLIEDSIAKSRRLSYDLSPAMLNYSGLPEAMSWLADYMRERFDMQVDLHADMPPEPPESMPVKLFVFRAARELLFNVVKHAGVKNARIGLESRDSSLVVTVGDRGRGFDPAALHLSNTPPGVGLPSLRERANYMGGSLVIESAPGEGSRFVLTVPLNARKYVKSESSAAERTRETEALPIDGEAVRVLFADDHKVMRQGLIKLVAGQAGIQVAGEAADGREAVEKALKLRPDVIVMDVSMPEMDGIEATRRIKAEAPEVRVIGLSMHEDDSIAAEMRKAGAEAFLSKSASPAELLGAVYGREAVGK